MSTLTTSAGEKLRDNRLARRPERATAGGILPGFGSRGQTANAHDPLGGTALTMLLVLYPALACAIVTVAAFLFCSPCGAA
ncbi:hypothetical protein KEU06_07195 [Pseudaminobacter sp. 19-2017]|uniref:Uncharacterized protein n=1 Tax=Pseudaminobacter soli (ex Zhang et al. 2022) TaxID=2831468 RepID=A0A942DZK3_9HYPH|nr:hypothetical protein [Pseudaminobacter soli]MBS3648413.1 hypothetical protein [Pseudaminobacter soli]